MFKNGYGLFANYIEFFSTIFTNYHSDNDIISTTIRFCFQNNCFQFKNAHDNYEASLQLKHIDRKFPLSSKDTNNYYVEFCEEYFHFWKNLIYFK